MTPRTAAEKTEEAPTPLDTFASIHQKRAVTKRRAGPARDDKRLFNLTPIPPRVLETRKLTIDPPFARLAIDTSYQRMELKSWVNDLGALLRKGGATPPIDVAFREWEGGERLWIVDGQQRYWAHWDASKPLTCLVHNVRTLQEEKDLFEALNNRRRVSANLTIHNHGGPTAALLVEVNDTPSHPLYQRVHFKSGAGGSRIAASSLTVALGRYCGSMRADGGIVSTLAGIDRFMGSSAGRSSVSAFLNVIGQVYAGQRPTGEMIYAVARGFAQGRVNAVSVTKPTLTRLRHLKLDRVKAATKKERIALMAARVQKSLTGSSTIDEEE